VGELQLLWSGANSVVALTSEVWSYTGAGQHELKLMRGYITEGAEQTILQFKFHFTKLIQLVVRSLWLNNSLNFNNTVISCQKNVK